MLSKTRCLLVVLLVGPACQGPDTATETAVTAEQTSTGSETTSETSTSEPTGTESGTTSATEGIVEWPAVDCNGAPCAAGEFCFQPIPLCELVAQGCGEDPEDLCWVDTPQDTRCMPVPSECEGTLAEAVVCLESSPFGPCEYGGTYQDGVLSCTYAFDHCEEGDSSYIYCQPCP